MIDEPGHPTGHLAIPERGDDHVEDNFRSAACRFRSRRARDGRRHRQDRAHAGHQDSAAPVAKTAQAPVIKAVQVKTSVLNANARMGRHHHSIFTSIIAFHKHMGALKTHQFSKVTIKHVTPATKRG